MIGRKFCTRLVHPLHVDEVGAMSHDRVGTRNSTFFQELGEMGQQLARIVHF
jgi:hypothetical protein